MRMCAVGMATVVAVLIGSDAYAQGTRDVSYTERAIVPVQAKLRFTTLIILPDGERILDFVCGDKDFWIVSGVDNLAYVKPAKAGASTNLNLITDSGRVYSFLLTEGVGEPDLKLYVVADDVLARGQTTKRFYTESDVAAFREEVERARQDAAAVRTASVKSADEAMAAFRASYPTQLRFVYRMDDSRRARRRGQRPADHRGLHRSLRRARPRTGAARRSFRPAHPHPALPVERENQRRSRCRSH